MCVSVLVEYSLCRALVCLQQKCQTGLYSPQKNPLQWISYHVKENSQITDWDSPLPWRSASKIRCFFIAQSLSSWQGSCLECQSPFCHACHSQWVLCCTWQGLCLGFCSCHGSGRPHGPLAVVTGSWLSPLQNECTYRHSKEKGRILACISSTLKCGISVYLGNLFCCYCSPVEDISSLNSLSERKDPSLLLFYMWEGRAARSLPSASTAGIEIPQVPARTPPVNYTWHPISKEQLKVSSMSFSLVLTFTFTVPSWSFLGRSHGVGTSLAAWVFSSPVKSLNYSRGWRGGECLEKKLAIYGSYQ